MAKCDCAHNGAKNVRPGLGVGRLEGNQAQFWAHVSGLLNSAQDVTGGEMCDYVKEIDKVRDYLQVEARGIKCAFGENLAKYGKGMAGTSLLDELLEFLGQVDAFLKAARRPLVRKIDRAGLEA